MCCLHVCTYIMYMPSDQGCQKRAFDSLELELQTVWAVMYVLGIKPRRSGQCSYSLSHLSSPYFFVCICINIHVCECWHACPCSITGQFHVLVLPFTCSEVRSLVFFSHVLETNWPKDFWRIICILLPSYLRDARIDQTVKVWLLCDSGASSWSPLTVTLSIFTHWASFPTLYSLPLRYFVFTHRIKTEGIWLEIVFLHLCWFIDKFLKSCHLPGISLETKSTKTLRRKWCPFLRLGLEGMGQRHNFSLAS